MHSGWQRCNAVLTFTGTVLAGLCILVSVTDVFHKSDPAVNVEVTGVKKFYTDRMNNEVAHLSFNIDADLRDVFSWNTKQIFVYLQAEYETEDFKVNQVSIWDDIIQSKENAHIKKKRVRQEYFLADHGRHLKGRPLNMTLTWEVMPRVGYLYSGSKTFEGFVMPEEYKW